MKPRITLLMGDRNGIGPELVARLLVVDGTYGRANVEVLGDPAVLDYAVSQSPVIFYVADLKQNSRVVFISSNVETITGHKAAAFLNDPEFGRAHVHPDDLAAYAAAAQACRGAGVGNREYRFATADGEARSWR